MIYDYKEALAEWQGISRKLKRYPRYFVQKPETNTTWCHIQTDGKTVFVLILHQMILTPMIYYFLSSKVVL